jgi:two-component system LytT family response regulator
MKLKVAIIDDEHEACRYLQNVIQEEAEDIIIAGVAHSAQEAEELINIHNPDAIFLDINMPGENVFDFLGRIKHVSFEVIFATSYDEYAIRAFKLNALDYVLKPICREEVSAVLEKLRKRIKYNLYLQQSSSMLNEVSLRKCLKETQNKIVLKDGNSMVVVPFNDICYVEARGNYSFIVFYYSNLYRNIIMSHPIAEYEELLPDDIFFRVHKSYLINCRRIEKIRTNPQVNLQISDGSTVPVSRRRFPLLIEFLRSANAPH